MVVPDRPPRHPLLQTDATATVVWRAEHEPYGTIHHLRTGLTKHQPLRFPGQEQPFGQELSYNVFRWYRVGLRERIQDLQNQHEVCRGRLSAPSAHWLHQLHATKPVLQMRIAIGLFWAFVAGYTLIDVTRNPAGPPRGYGLGIIATITMVAALRQLRSTTAWARIVLVLASLLFIFVCGYSAVIAFQVSRTIGEAPTSSLLLFAIGLAAGLLSLAGLLAIRRRDDEPTK